MPLPGPGLSTVNLADVSGLTERQIDRYSLAGAFGPQNKQPGSGFARRFTRTDVRIAIVLRQLAVIAGGLMATPPSLGQPVVASVSLAMREGNPENRWLVIDVEGVSVQAGKWQFNGHPAVMVDLHVVDDIIARL